MSSSQAGDSNSAHEHFGTPNLIASDGSPFEDGELGMEDGDERSFFVRALYEFQSDDVSSLSFTKGTLIEVLTQLESGWWDGLLGNDVRGWFPSNYVERISEDEAMAELTEQYVKKIDAVPPLAGAHRQQTSIDALTGKAAQLSLERGSAGTSGPTDGMQYADLGLGQDFDALRRLMNGIPSSGTDGTDAFEQLAEAGLTADGTSNDSKTASGSIDGQDDRLNVLDARRRKRLSDQSSQIESLLTTNSSLHSNYSQTDVSSVPARSAAGSLSDADGSRKNALVAAQAANAQLDAADRERIRAHTVSGSLDNTPNGTPQVLAGRPRAQTAYAGAASSTANGGDGTDDARSPPRALPTRLRPGRSSASSREEDSFWVPKVSDRGEIFYYNTRTGQHARDLPERSDSSGRAETPDSYRSDADAEEEMQDGASISTGTRKSGGTHRSKRQSDRSNNNGNDTTYSRSSLSSSLHKAPSRSDAIEKKPDAQDVPWPWVVQTSDDQKTFFFFNKETHEVSHDIDAVMSADSNNTLRASTSSRQSAGKQSDAASIANTVATRSSRSASVIKREEEMTPAAIAALRHADERDAWMLQRRLVADEAQPKSVRTILNEAGDAIAALASIASEPIGTGGLSEEDVKALSSQSSSLSDTSRLSLAIGKVVQTIRDLLQASGALAIAPLDLLTATEAIQLVDGEASLELSVAFVTLLSAVQGKDNSASESDPNVVSAQCGAMPPAPISLLPLGKKINATLSKLVLSARSVVEQSCLNVETRPHFSNAQLDKIASYRNRIKDDSMELARALGAFGNEANQWQIPASGVAPWMRRMQGVLRSGTGAAGIGLDVLVGGAAAGWRGQGFVLPTAAEIAALRAESMGSFENPFELTLEAQEALASGKVALRRKPTHILTRKLIEGSLDNRFARVERSIGGVGSLIIASQQAGASESLAVADVLGAVRRAMRHFGGLITLIEEVDLATTLDVDGPRSGVDTHGVHVDGYRQSVAHARELLHALARSKQEAYDASSLLLVYAQDRSADASAKSGFLRSVDGFEELGALLGVFSSKMQELQGILSDLVDIGETQAKQTFGQIGSRAKVYGIDDVKMKMVEDKAEEKDGVIYLGPGLAVPDGPSATPPSATSSGTDGRSFAGPVAPPITSAPSSLKAMFTRGRSTSVVTGHSVASGDSNSRILGPDEADAAIAALRGPARARRETEASVSGMPSAPESTVGDMDAASSLKVVEEVPWYLQDDTPPDDIVFNHNGQVRGATLAALLGRLTMHNAFDSGFNTTFLMTYRSFTTTDELMNSLFSRFRLAPPEGLTADEYEQWVEKKQRPIRFRVFNVLKAWLELHFDDPENDGHLQRIKDFAENEMQQSSAMATPARLLLRSIERRSGKGEQMKITMVMPSSAPAPILPKNFRKIKFLDIDPLEMARQLTLMDSRLYNRIRPAECLGKSWSRDNGAIIAKNVRDVISANNRVSGWVSEAILVQEDVKKRAAWVKQFVAIADRCFYLNNFSSMMSIYSGLNNASLNRLRRTWDAVNQRHLQLFDNMREILAPTRNFSRYRETLRKLNPPCVPFLGVYLTDLTFLEDGNADKLRGGDHLINFGKRQMTAEKIQEIMIYQSTPYNLTPVPGIQRFIEENLIEARSDDELFEQSLRLEPREREDEKIARLLQESGFL